MKTDSSLAKWEDESSLKIHRAVVGCVGSKNAYLPHNATKARLRANDVEDEEENY